MESGERERAVGLIEKKIGRLGIGEKLKVSYDVDDTVAATSPSVLRHLGIDPGARGRHYYWPTLTHERFMQGYNELWLDNWQKVEPLLSYESAQKLAKAVSFSFISARDEKTAETLRHWVSHFYQGLKIPVTAVSPHPHEAHGANKLRTGIDILVDDSPVVPPVMRDSVIAKDSILFVIDSWDEATEDVNPANTVIARDAEEAADIILESLKPEPAEKEKLSSSEKAAGV